MPSFADKRAENETIAACYRRMRKTPHRPERGLPGRAKSFRTMPGPFPGAHHRRVRTERNSSPESIPKRPPDKPFLVQNVSAIPTPCLKANFSDTRKGSLPSGHGQSAFRSRRRSTVFWTKGTCPSASGLFSGHPENESTPGRDHSKQWTPPDLATNKTCARPSPPIIPGGPFLPASCPAPVLRRFGSAGRTFRS